jgi:RNA polymerase-binding transcription factor DksA
MSHITEEQIHIFKSKLEAEQTELEKQLKNLGRVNPSNPADWEPTPDKGDNPMRADKNELADSMEDFEENTAILRELEIRINNVNKALERIASGTYGQCKEGDEIPLERLEANPAAETCIAHAEKDE